MPPEQASTNSATLTGSHSCVIASDQPARPAKAGSTSGDWRGECANQDATATQLLRRAEHIEEAGLGWNLAAATGAGIVTLTRQTPDGAGKEFHRVEVVISPKDFRHGFDSSSPLLICQVSQ